jgi:hypothetical protein
MNLFRLCPFLHHNSMIGNIRKYDKIFKKRMHRIHNRFTNLHMTQVETYRNEKRRYIYKKPS